MDSRGSMVNEEQDEERLVRRLSRADLEKLVLSSMRDGNCIILQQIEGLLPDGKRERLFKRPHVGHDEVRTSPSSLLDSLLCLPVLSFKEMM